MDKIIIKDLKIFAYHGVNQEEKDMGQNFVLDIILFNDLSGACKTDDINDTVSYAKVIKTAVRAMTAEKFDLIERAAQYAAEMILEEYPPVKKVKITLKKPEAPMKVDFGYVAVKITRKRGNI